MYIEADHDTVRDAQERAVAVLQHLETLGVKAVLTGPLSHDEFPPGAEVELLVLFCPRDKKYRIEADVEDILVTLPFQVVYREEAPAFILARMEADALTAEQIVSRRR